MGRKPGLRSGKRTEYPNDLLSALFWVVQDTGVGEDFYRTNLFGKITSIVKNSAHGSLTGTEKRIRRYRRFFDGQYGYTASLAFA